MRFLQPLLFVCFALIGITGFSGEARAWGKFGHLTVCDLAYRNLTRTSRAALNDLLQSRSGGINVPGRGRLSNRVYTSFNIGCLEEDAMPRRHPEDHFLNLDRNVTAITGARCPTATPDCILSGLQRDLAILRDPQRSRADRVFAMMAIGHWLGDIHQPLHISYADDRGGNGIDIRLTGRCGGASPRPDNLHAVWDNCLLEAGLFEKVRRRADYQPNWSRNTITYRAVDTLLANTSLGAERTLVSGDPWQWAAESYQITRAPETLYCTLQGAVCRYSPEAIALTRTGTKRVQLVDSGYLTHFSPIAEEQVRRAGFRLAHLLNLALDPAYREPARDGTQPA